MFRWDDSRDFQCWSFPPLFNSKFGRIIKNCINSRQKCKVEYYYHGLFLFNRKYLHEWLHLQFVLVQLLRYVFWICAHYVNGWNLTQPYVEYTKNATSKHWQRIRVFVIFIKKKNTEDKTVVTFSVSSQNVIKIIIEWISWLQSLLRYEME